MSEKIKIVYRKRIGKNFEIPKIQTLNGGWTKVNFYEVPEGGKGDFLHFSDELDALFYYYNGFLYIRFSDCMLEIPVEDLMHVFEMILRRRKENAV